MYFYLFSENIKNSMSNLRNSANYVWSTSFVLGKGATGFVYQGVHKVSTPI